MKTAMMIVALGFLTIGCGAPEEDASATAELKTKHPPDLSQPPPVDMAHAASAAHHCEMVNGVMTGKCINATCTPSIDHCGDCFAGQTATVYAHADCPGVTVATWTCYLQGQICP